jgi:hypothetical protein
MARFPEAHNSFPPREFPQQVIRREFDSISSNVRMHYGVYFSIAFTYKGGCWLLE